MLTVLYLTGCGGVAYSQKTSNLNYADELNVRFSSDLVPASVSLVQQVVFQKGADKFEFTVMVDASSKEVVMAGLSPLGKRQFLITADADHVRYDAEILFELPFPPKYLVRDFLLVFGNAQAIRQQLGNAHVTESGGERVYRFEKETMRISYSVASSGERFVEGNVVCSNLEDGYTLNVATVQVEHHSRE